MLTLVLNSGSSSVKFALLDPRSSEVRLSGLIERLGSDAASATLKTGGEKKQVTLKDGTYASAFGLIAGELDALNVRQEVQAVGHRVVHGGEKFSGSVLLTPEVMAALRECIPLAPLHNPPNIAGIEAAQLAFPNLPQVGVFDTAFHQTMPPVAYRYAVPESWYTQHGVRRYGFHGTSHQYVAQEAARMLGKPLEDLNLVTAHLGNGCSATAVRGGHSVDSSMGFTPLEGLVMGTRSGDVDPGLHDFMARQAGLTLTQIMTALNKESGLLGVSGLTNDMRELEAASARGHERAALALDLFIYRLAKTVAALSVPLGRLDALVFTGGIGENSELVRARTLGHLGLLGFKLDEHANQRAVRGQGGLITIPGSTPALVVNTNEELMIARETMRLVALNP
ncbi:acetate kinase [Deinococcus cavernae]|uniref:Acetate kinase n=1 Tax=Deinococcus cavernae TaxID=2320857 RepID=A0A418V859_9DEIO|nr:acetate kinase [Deinococcus cavernae]RJF72256.1 acetate kinase [Deinococcus cavernae]